MSLVRTSHVSCSHGHSTDLAVFKFIQCTCMYVLRWLLPIAVIHAKKVSWCRRILPVFIPVQSTWGWNAPRATLFSSFSWTSRSLYVESSVGKSRSVLLIWSRERFRPSQWCLWPSNMKPWRTRTHARAFHMVCLILRHCFPTGARCILDWVSVTWTGSKV